MKVLVKLGGSLLEDAATLHSLSAELAVASSKHDLAVVHGGGKQVTRFLEERGVASQFVNGLRVSDHAVIDAVTKVIAGTLNKQLVASLVAAGRPAVGLSGIDGPLTTAVPLDPALGAVGRPLKSDGRLLTVLVGAGFTPVIACIAGDREGRIFNVNADQMAVSCAVGWQADKLLFLTDVPGVKGSDGRIIPRLDAPRIAVLISSGVAHGGMQAKLEAALVALQGGLHEVTIASGRDRDVCTSLLRGDELGTRLSLTPLEVV